jgi:hypothetical protein
VTTQAYAGGDRESLLTGGGVLFMAASALAAILMLAALLYSFGIGQRHLTALAAAECEPNLSPSGLQCTTVQMLTGEYLAIFNPTSQQLVADTADYNANDHRNLTAAKAALSAEVTSERAFDASMASFPFPPMAAPAAKALIQTDQALAQLTAEQEKSTSLARMGTFDHRVNVATTAVETELKLLRQALAIKPTVADGG